MTHTNNPIKLRNEPVPQLMSHSDVDQNFKNLMRWAGDWEDPTPDFYEANQVVLDYPWLMIANKQTQQKAAPVLDGDPQWIIDEHGTPVWTTPTMAGVSGYITAHRYALKNFVRVSGYRVYCPDATGNFDYEVWTYDSDMGAIQQLAPFVPSVAGWVAIPVSSDVPAALVFDVMLITRSVVQPNVFTANWQTKNENSNPGSGEAIFRNNATEIRIHNTDKDDTNQETNLNSVNVGGTIAFGGMEWTITNITTTGSGAGGRHNFFITPNQGRPSENVYPITFTWGSSAPIPYVKDAGFWLGMTKYSVQGFEAESYDFGNPPPGTDDAYGIDLLVEDYNTPTDWDFMAHSEF